MSRYGEFVHSPFSILGAQKPSATKEKARKKREKQDSEEDLKEESQSLQSPSPPTSSLSSASPDEGSLFIEAMRQGRFMPSPKKSKKGFTLEERSALEYWQTRQRISEEQGSGGRKKRLSSVAPALRFSSEKRAVESLGHTAVSSSKATFEKEDISMETLLASVHQDMDDDDQDVFLSGMKGVEPLGGKGRDVVPESHKNTAPAQEVVDLQDIIDGKMEFALSLTNEYMEGFVVGLDEVIMNKLRAGAYSPEAYLDLHGLNAVQAFQTMLNFFRSSWYKGLRTVLLVPGRGNNSANGVGVLRDKVQAWLTQEPFKRIVLAFCTAQRSDGGLGSVYVLLRKYRKKGRVYWERMPMDPDLL